MPPPYHIDASKVSGLIYTVGYVLNHNQELILGSCSGKYPVVLICDWICKKGLIHAIINIWKYNIEIFNSVYLENDWSYLHVFLHKSIAIQSNSLYLLYTG